MSRNRKRSVCQRLSLACSIGEYYNFTLSWVAPENFGQNPTAKTLRAASNCQHGASAKRRNREMGPQKTRRSSALILAAFGFIVFIFVNLTCHHNPGFARSSHLSICGEDQSTQPFYEDLLRSLQTALTSSFSIAFCIEQLTGANPVPALLLPLSPRFNLSVRGPPHTTHS